MIKKSGVYTIKCPKCGRSIIIHVSSDGSISPKKCSACQAEFEGIDKGEERNTFVVVVKEKKTTIVVNQEVEEETKKTGKQTAKKKEETKKTGKKTAKNHFKW